MEVVFSETSPFDRRSKEWEGADSLRAQADAATTVDPRAASDPPSTCKVSTQQQPGRASFEESAFPGGPMEEAHVALQHMREAVLGSIHGSKRHFKKCILFEIPPRESEASDVDADVTTKLKIEDKRQEVLGARHGTPLRCRRVFSLDADVIDASQASVKSNNLSNEGAAPAVPADVETFRRPASRHTRRESCPSDVLHAGSSPRGKATATHAKLRFPQTLSCDNRAQGSSASSSYPPWGASPPSAPHFRGCTSPLPKRRSLLPASLGLVASSEPTLLSSPGVDEGWRMEFSSPKCLLFQASSPNALPHGKSPKALMTRSSRTPDGSLRHQQGARAPGLALTSHKGHDGGALACTPQGRRLSFDSPSAQLDCGRRPGYHHTGLPALVPAPPMGPGKAAPVGPVVRLPTVAQSEPVLVLGALEEEQSCGGEDFWAPDLAGLRGDLLRSKEDGQVEMTAALREGSLNKSFQGRSSTRWARKAGSFRQLLRHMTVDTSALEGALWPQRRQAQATQKKAPKGSSLKGQGARMALDANTEEYYSTNG